MTENPQLTLAYDFLENTGTHIFLTGKAGTGKTTFLQNLRRQSPKRMVVVAPTGVAAINAGGVTMHSFFQLPFGAYIPDTVRVKAGGDGQQVIRRFNKEKIAIIRSMDLLVIDEISMVRSDMLDAVDEVLRRYRDRYKPFGGVQLLMIGDLQQLAPVVRDEEWTMLRNYYQSPLFFDSHALKSTSYTSIELKHIYRQSDTHFIDLLAKVRNNEMDAATLAELNQRYKPGFNPPQEEGYIMLTSHNNAARSINDTKLAELKAAEYRFEARVTGNFPEHMYPIEYTLCLKLGSQVMFTKNDVSPEKRFVNGTIGTVTAISDDRIEVVPTGSDAAISVERADWENNKYTIDEATKQVTETVEGVFNQYPLKTAWAITIHKSQGLTFERAIIDAADSFSHGQVYVALSRCKSLEGLVLRSPLSSRAIINDATVKEFNADVERNQPTAQMLDQHKMAYYKELLMELFDFAKIESQMRYLRRQTYEHLHRLYPKLIERWETTLPAIDNDIMTVSLRFRSQIERLCGENYATDATLSDRVTKGAAYFEGKLMEVISPLLAASRVDIDNKEAKKAVGDALARVMESVYVKLAVLRASSAGFSIAAYLDAKSKAVAERATAPKTKAAKEGKEPREAKVETSDDILNAELFRLLREWRREEAGKINMPAYVVMTQKALIGVSNTIPTSGAEMLKIKGIGKKFIEKYGAEVLSILDDFRAGRIGSEVSDTDYTDEDKDEELGEQLSSKELTFKLFSEGRSAEEIAVARDLAESTITAHLVPYITTGQIDIARLMSKEKLETVVRCIAENESEKLSVIKEKLGDEYSYSDLNYAVAYLKIE